MEKPRQNWAMAMATRNPSSSRCPRSRRYCSPEGHWACSSSARAWKGSRAERLDGAGSMSRAASASGKKASATPRIRPSPVPKRWG